MDSFLSSIESTFKPVVWQVLEMYDQIISSGKYNNINECLAAFCKKMIKGNDLGSCFVISAQGIKIESVEWQPIVCSQTKVDFLLDSVS
jgi:hypothetical protein